MLEKWRPLRGFEGIYWVGDNYHIRNSKNHILKPIKAVIKNRRLSLVYKLSNIGQFTLISQPQATRRQFKSEERHEWVNPIIVTSVENECPLCKSRDVYMKKAYGKAYLVCQNCGERFKLLISEER